jgi:hypothetical protein
MRFNRAEKARSTLFALGPPNACSGAGLTTPEAGSGGGNPRHGQPRLARAQSQPTGPAPAAVKVEHPTAEQP